MILDDILARGQQIYQRFIVAKYAEDVRPFGGGSINIVTRVDFIANAELCLDFVTPVRSLHVLDQDGSIRALLSSKKPTDT